MADQTIAELAAEFGLEIDKDSFAEAHEAMNKLAEEAMEQVIEKANEMAKDVNKSVGEMAKSVGEAGKASEEAAKGEEKAGEAAHKEARGHEDAAHGAHEHGEAVEHLGEFIAGYLGLEAVHKLHEMAEETIEVGAKMGDLADKTGTSVEEIQELGYAAKIHGLSTEYMSNVLGKLSANLAAAGRGSKEQAAAFQRAGISIKDQEGKIRPAADVLGDIADHLKGLSEEERPARAMELLGRSGRDLIPLLKDGSEGLEKFRQEARDLGLVMDKETVEAFDKVEKNTKRAGAAFDGLKQQAIITLLPAITELTETMLKWIKANRADIVKAMAAAFKFVAGAAKAFLFILKNSLKVVSWLVKNWQLAVVGLTALAAAYVILNASALAAAAAELIALWPIGLLAIAIAALILVVDDLYEAFTGGESIFKDLYNIVKEWVVEKIGELMNTWVGDFIRYYEKVWDVIKASAQTLYDEIKSIVDLVMKAYEIYKKVKGYGLAGGGSGLLDLDHKEGGWQGQYDKYKNMQDQIKAQIDPSAPTVNVPGSGENTSAPIQATANVTNTFNINGGDPEQIKKAVAENQARIARVLETTLGVSAAK